MTVNQVTHTHIYAYFVNMVCFAHRQFGTRLPLATVSSQKGQQSGQSMRAIYITCSSLKWDLVHIGFTSRLTGVGVHPGWLCPWFGPGCADFVFACRIVKVLSLSLLASKIPSGFNIQNLWSWQIRLIKPCVQEALQAGKSSH